MSSANTIYFITGGNRGIGKALVATYLSRSNNTVIAGVRDPTSSSAKALSIIPKGCSSSLIIIKLDSKSETDAAAAISTLQSNHAITHLDVVVANAGISSDFSTVATVPPSVFREHIEINGYGALYLIQAVLPLLRTSKLGKLVGVGSPFGSIGGMEQQSLPSAAYGSSKALLHWLIRKVHFENKNLISFVIDPGFVRTDMGKAGADHFGIPYEHAIPVDDSVRGIVSTIDSATREKTSAHFIMHTGEESSW